MRDKQIDDRETSFPIFSKSDSLYSNLEEACIEAAQREEKETNRKSLLIQNKSH